MSESRPHRRRHYRVAYPPNDAPTLHTKNGQATVINISEEGMKFACDVQQLPALTSEIQGTVVFGDGQAFEIEGKIVRVEVAARLSKAIPYEKIVKEQIQLIKKYPGYRSKQQ